MDELNLFLVMVVLPIDNKRDRERNFVELTIRVGRIWFSWPGLLGGSTAAFDCTVWCLPAQRHHLDVLGLTLDELSAPCRGRTRLIVSYPRCLRVKKPSKSDSGYRDAEKTARYSFDQLQQPSGCRTS